MPKRPFAALTAVCAALATTLLASCAGGGGGVSPSTVPSSSGIINLATEQPDPANSATVSTGAYEDDGSRLAVSGAMNIPTDGDLLQTQSVAATPSPFYDNFQNQSLDAWKPLLGNWKICSYIGSSFEYCGTSTGDQAISTSGSTSLRNYRIEAWVRLAHDADNASIVSRYQDNGHFYELELRTFKGIKSWFIWKNVYGAWTSLAGGNFNFVANTYYRLRLDSYGSSFLASISTDGISYRDLGAGTDSSYSSGPAGLRTFGSATASFDGVYVAPLLAPPTLAPASVPSSSPASGLTAKPSAVPSAALTSAPLLPAPPIGVSTPLLGPAGTNFTMALGPEQIISTSVPGPGMDAGTRRNFPDAHFSVVQEPAGGYAMYWGIGNTYKTTGPDQYPQHQSMASIVLATYGDTGFANPWEAGSQGNWMLSVNRVGESNSLIGFEHLEESDVPNVYLYNTVVTRSEDDGQTWSVGQRILTFPSPYPGNTPLPSQYVNTGYGPGNDIVIRDNFKSRWVLITPQSSNAGFYTSTDPSAAAGTWARGTDLTISGTFNPAVVWDSYLDEWLMFWHNGCNLYYSTSPSLDQWTPQGTLLLGGADHCYSYPTVIGTDDKTAGQVFTLYYADWNGPYLAQARSFEYQNVTLQRTLLSP